MLFRTVKVSLTFIVALILVACSDSRSPSGGTGQGETAEARQLLPAVFSDGWVFVKVSVNAAPDVWMLLDTGTVPSVINMDYARSLGLTLKATSEIAQGVGTERVPLFETRVAQLRAGPVTREDILFDTNPMKGWSGPDGKPLAGVLGYSFLKDAVLVVDYRKSELYFSLTGRCACDLAMAFDHHVPTIPIKIAGHGLRAIIDTAGGDEMIITPETARDIGLGALLDEAQPTTGFGYAGAQSGRVGHAPDIAVGTIGKANPTVLYISFGNAPLKSGAQLGKDFLKNFKLTLDYRARTARLEP